MRLCLELDNNYIKLLFFVSCLKNCTLWPFRGNPWCYSTPKQPSMAATIQAQYFFLVDLRCNALTNVALVPIVVDLQ